MRQPHPELLMQLVVLVEIFVLDVAPHLMMLQEMVEMVLEPVVMGTARIMRRCDTTSASAGS